MKRQVVNINQDVYDKLQEYCNIHNLKINGLVETLINKGIKTMTSDIARIQTQEYWKRKEAESKIDKTYLESVLKDIDERSKLGHSYTKTANCSEEKIEPVALYLVSRGFKVSREDDNQNKGKILVTISW